jgi:prevent-host-death family protein
MPKPSRQTATLLIPALRARSHFGKLLQRVERERRSVVIEKRGTPRAILLSIQDYVRLAAPEPEILQLLGAESLRKGTDKLTSAQIDRLIRKTRARKPKS